jgi:hypothetical protein
VHFDLPGVDASSIGVMVEHSVMSASRSGAGSPPKRPDRRIGAAARAASPVSCSREGLDGDRVGASYTDGELTARQPPAERGGLQLPPRGRRQTGAGRMQAEMPREDDSGPARTTQFTDDANYMVTGTEAQISAERPLAG